MAERGAGNAQRRCGGGGQCEGGAALYCELPAAASEKFPAILC